MCSYYVYKCVCTEMLAINVYREYKFSIQYRLLCEDVLRNTVKNVYTSDIKHLRNYNVQVDIKNLYT